MFSIHLEKLGESILKKILQQEDHKSQGHPNIQQFHKDHRGLERLHSLLDNIGILHILPMFPEIKSYFISIEQSNFLVLKIDMNIGHM